MAKKDKLVNSYNKINHELEKKIDRMMSVEIPDDDQITLTDTSDLKIIDNDQSFNNDQVTVNNLNDNASLLKEKTLVLDKNNFENHDSNQDIKVNITKDFPANLEVISSNNIVNDDLDIDDSVIEEIEKNESNDLLILEDMLEDELNNEPSPKPHHKVRWIIGISLLIILIAVYIIYIRGKNW